MSFKNIHHLRRRNNLWHTRKMIQVARHKICVSIAQSDLIKRLGHPRLANARHTPCETNQFPHA